MAKTPSTLRGLEELIARAEDKDVGSFTQKDYELTVRWLTYTYTTLRDRTVYHKKQQVRRKMLLKVAKEMLDQSELESIDRQAEELAERKLEVEDVLHGSTEERKDDEEEIDLDLGATA